LAVAATISGERHGELIEAGIVPALTPAQMAAYGVTAPDAPDAPCALIDLATPGEATEYRLGFGNFYVLTRYNRSSFYAMTVSDLSRALRDRREKEAAGD
jgi:membrane-bound lytic murein transglycosylase B